ncbi:MAG: TIGR03085 family metal-binding protein [Actinomycetota bacterium]|nr:TIGR03085 family metal-binding protein [Actinomycetota bacterium]
MSLARTERSAVADLLAQVGPTQPTLCDGWDTGDLLAHLLVRERRPDAATGMRVPPLAGYLRSASQTFSKRPWVEQLRLYREGPPGWNPLSWGKLDDLTNSAEMFVHHEDVRRGVEGWKPRQLDQATTEAITGMLESRAMKWATRSLKCGVVAALPNGRTIELKRGTPIATVHGAPAEVLLWVFGRDACQVELTGDDAALAAVAGGHRKM